MIPKHIGFIMDGNGRWAVSKGLERQEGYVHGLNALKKVASACQSNGVEAITLYAFSTENNQRPSNEINSIFGVITDFNYSLINDYKIKYIGNISELPKQLVDSINKVESRTQNNTGLKINICLNYGSKADILNAVKQCVMNPEDNIQELFEKSLSSSNLPQLDLIVRTGGEKRLSNFLLYEAAYAELIFIDKFWPDMTEKDVKVVLDEFEKRTRKFGK